MKIRRIINLKELETHPNIRSFITYVINDMRNELYMTTRKYYKHVLIRLTEDKDYVEIEMDNEIESKAKP